MVLHSPSNHLWQPGTDHTPEHIKTAVRAGRMIPSGQTVAATMGQLASLGARDDVCWNQCPTPPDWLLLDQATGMWWQRDGGPAAMAGPYPSTVGYRTVFHSGEVWLLKRVR